MGRSVKTFRLRFWGTRGSIPSPGPTTLKYGGNTSCVEVRTADGQLFIFDCGSGMRPLGIALENEDSAPLEGHIFLSHTHWDHIQGFPFFAPAFNRQNRFNLYAARSNDRTLHELLSLQMEYSYFPVRLKSLGARLCFHELEEGAFDLGKVHIAVHYLNHTSLTLGYRLTCGGKSLAYCTDVEPGALTLWREDLIGPKGVPPKESLIKGIVHLEDRRLVEFCRGVDVLILDSQYTDEEYRIKKKTGWGHSTGQFAARVAIASGARHLFFFHHDPNHADSQIDENIAAGRKLAQGFAIGIEGAREGEEVAL